MKLTMRFLALALAILMISATASAQTPAPVGSYVNSGSGWTPLLGTATQGALAFNPPPAALYVFNSSLGKWVPWPGTSGGGGSGTVLSFSASNLTPLFTTSVATATTTPALTFTLTNAPANSVLGNPTGTVGTPSYTSSPVVTSIGILGTSTSSLPGPLSITDGTTATGLSYGFSHLAAGLPAGGSLAWVNGQTNSNGNSMVINWNQTASTATNNWCLSIWGMAATCDLQGYLNGKLVGLRNTFDDGTGAATFVGNVTAPTFNGTVPTGQFASSSRISPIANTNGLIGEYHLTEASGATTGIDYSGLGNNGTYFGTPTLTGTVLGGMTSAGAGGMDYPNSFNTTAVTISNYVCLNALAATSATLPLLVGGLISSTTPTFTNLQAFGLMMNSVNSTVLANVVGVGKYDTTPAVYNGTAAPTIGAQSTDGCHLISWRRGTTNDQLFIDGSEVSSYFAQGTGTVAQTPATGSLSLGMPHYATLPNAAFAFPYPVYFSFVFNRALTAAEIQTLAGSAQSYAQFRGIIKTPTNYVDAGNQVLYVGDSITVAINTATPWPRMVSTVNAPTNTPYIPVTAGLPGSANNIGTASWQIQNMIQECQSRGYGSMNPNSGSTIVIWGGTNDLGIGTTATPVVTYQRLRRLVQCYKSGPHQPRVFVMTMISRTGNGNGGVALDTLKNQFNALVRQDYAGADGLIDIASFPGLGADGAFANPTLVCAGAACFQADGVHPATPAQQIIATYVANYLNWADAKTNGTNPILVTSATYTNPVGDTAVNTNPTSTTQNITLPSAVGLIGTDRYFSNVQTSGTNTVTLTAASGENIDGNPTLVCANATKCLLKSVLGATPGLATGQAAIAAGAHWEQFGFSGGGSGSSGNATSIWNIPVSATPPTTGQLVGYDGTSIVGVNATGGTVPTGTGFEHVTAGAQDGAARAVNLASADVTGVLPIANLPVGGNTTAGILQCDGTTTTCAGGLITATGSGGGGAGLAANTFTGIQIMPSLQDTPVNDTGLVNAAVVANTSVTALSAGEILTFIPVATNTTGTPTLNVNSLGAKVITKLGNVAVVAGDLVINSIAVVVYNSAGSGTWQLLNPGTLASLNANQSFQGTQTFSTLNFTSVLQKGGVGVFPVTRCVASTSTATTANCSATGTTTTGVCVAFPANAIAVTLNTTNAPFVTVPTTNLPTLTFASAATAGAIYNVMCTPN